MEDIRRLSSHKITAVLVITSFFVLFPLSGVVIGVVYAAQDAQLHSVLIGLIALVTFVVVVLIWFLVTGIILNKMSKGLKE